MTTSDAPGPAVVACRWCGRGVEPHGVCGFCAGDQDDPWLGDVRDLVAEWRAKRLTARRAMRALATPVGPEADGDGG